MPFDPDRYISQTGSQAVPTQRKAFDPDAYLAENDVGMTKSFLLGAAQGVSFGFADELAGVAYAVKEALKGRNRDEAYTEGRDAARATFKKAESANPKAYLAGEFSSVLVPGGVVAKGAGVAARVGRAAIAGGATGAGMSEADTPLELAKDVATGAALGGGSAGLLEFVGRKAAGIAPEKLRAYAAERAVKASGAMKGDFNKIQKTIGVENLGRQLIEKKVVTPFASLETVAERAGALREASGQEIGEALKKVDDLVKKAKQSLTQAAIPPRAKGQLAQQIDEEFQFSTRQIGKRIEDELIKPNLRKPSAGITPQNLKDPGLRGEMEKLQSLADDYKSGKPITLVEGGQIKTRQGKQTRFHSETIPEAFKQEVYSIIKTQLDNVVAKTEALEDGVAKLTGNAQIGIRAPGAASASKAYTDAKKAYAAAKTSEEMALNRLGAIQSNRGVSLTDTIAGASGIASGGGPVTAIALGAINKFGRQYGATMQMYGADKLADILSTQPMKLGQKYLGPLLDSASKGPAALAATHAYFMKDPEYQQEIGAEIQIEESPLVRRFQTQGAK